MILKTIKNLICLIMLMTSQRIYCDDSFSGKKIKEFTLRNGINVILHEDFRMPVVLVGVIFHVESVDAPIDKSGITAIIAANLINKKTHNSFIKSGISYETSAFSEYTEIFAKMNPSKIKEFFNQICSSFSDIQIENLNVYKKQMIIENKLSKYFLNSALVDNIFSNIDSKNIFNESSLLSINSDDVISFYNDNFQTCKVSIIVVGSVDYRNLIKNLRASISNISDRKQKIITKNSDRKYRDILLESKYIRNSIRYIYSLPSCESKKLEEVFLSVLHDEVFRFFCKNHSLLLYYNKENIFSRGDSVWLFSLFPKKDISINELQKFYNVFVKKMITIPLEHKRLSRIAALKKMETQFLISNLFAVYQNIKNAYMRKLDLASIYTVSDDIEQSDPEMIRSFAGKFFHKNLVSTVITRFRSDK